MTITKLVLVLLCLVPVTLGPKEAKVTPLFSKDLTDFPGKEGVMIRNIRRVLRTQYIATAHMHLFMSLRAQS
jgi:hypothetical protein